MSNADEIPFVKPDTDRDGPDNLPTTQTGRPIIREVLKNDSPRVLNGRDVKSLAEGIHEYTLASGDRVTASTDKGIGYKDHNEDRVVVVPEFNAVSVIDGMGGTKNGEMAAECLAEAFLKHPTDPKKATELASSLIEAGEKKDEEEDEEEYDESGEVKEESGACFASVRILAETGGEKSIEIAKAGDVKILIFNENGDLEWQSKDDSEAQVLIDANALTEAEALYYPRRHVVTEFVKAGESKMEIIKKPVKKGYKILIITDGISDNIIPVEIEKNTRGMNPRQIIKYFSDETSRRMRDAKDIIQKTYDNGGPGVVEKCSDGFFSYPHPDNRGIAIIEIN